MSVGYKCTRNGKVTQWTDIEPRDIVSASMVTWSSHNRRCASNDCMRRYLGRSGDLSPYNDMTSMYFDDSLYENKGHYRIAQLLDETPLDEDCEEIRIVCDTEEEYNNVLNDLYHKADESIRIFGVSNNPMEIIIEKDPRLKYRKFDEDAFLINKDTEEKK